jgi:NAD(P)-dependent dehydrogenase (short-subunit alcohol dehydrogenase family)
MQLLAGAGSGIGRAVCQVLAREGAKVIAADQNGIAAQETQGLLSSKYDWSLHRQCWKYASFMKEQNFW